MDTGMVTGYGIGNLGTIFFFLFFSVQDFVVL